MVLDTAHLTLAGMDPLAMIKEFYPRIAEVHYKDVPAKFRGWKGPAAKEMTEDGKSLFQPMGTGGVDFPAIQKYLVEKNFKGWVTLDYDASMIPKGSTMEALLTADKKYIIDVLKVDPKEI
jgi:inosose dehydratase